jgi:hypothetical protein
MALMSLLKCKMEREKRFEDRQAEARLAATREIHFQDRSALLVIAAQQLLQEHGVAATESGWEDTTDAADGWNGLEDEEPFEILVEEVAESIERAANNQSVKACQCSPRRSLRLAPESIMVIDDIPNPYGQDESVVETDTDAETEIEMETETETETDSVVKTKIKTSARGSTVNAKLTEAPKARQTSSVNLSFRVAVASRLFDNVSRKFPVRVPPGFIKCGAFFRKKVVKYKPILWDDIKPHLFPSKTIKISAYVNNYPGLYSCEEICAGFEKCGYVSFSIIGDIRGESTPEESALIDR